LSGVAWNFIFLVSMKSNFIILLVVLGIVAGCKKSPESEVTFMGSTSRWIFSNGVVTVVVKSSRGIYEIFRNSDQKRIITGAYMKIDQDSTNEPLRKADYQLSDFTKGGETGKYLLITSSKENGNGLGLRFGLLPGKEYVVIDGGIMNKGSNSLQIKKFSILSNGLLYGGKKLNPGFRMMDGNGGGEDTRVTESPVLDCRNNFLLTWGKPDAREVLVAGGLTYSEVEKFVHVSPLRENLSDFRIWENQVAKSMSGVSKPVNQVQAKVENMMLTLYSEDPVGKRVDPGQSWFPEDAFYVSVGHDNPYEAIEQYGDALKLFQEVDLAYYTFPTVCLWYAQQTLYGDGPSVNDAPGAVAEMDRAVKSGFLRYVPVSIRLVPDAYEENNEQGWWDDSHWQMYGTGKFANPPDRNVDVGRRSDDYAAAYPGHMLFNGTTAGIPDQDWMIKGKVSYDFTDKDFLVHMKEVYKNLADGGVRGLMYDYPYTAWSQYGGMDDEYSTTASAYRTVFQLARTGLGNSAYLDERNLDHGSDITLGIVTSQRIWGDTDKMSPLMITRGALRWYKNRKVVSYDMDAKNLLKAQPANSDGVRKLLTLMYTTSGRFLMANSFDRLSPEMLHDLSRIFPFPDSWISARPVDAFVSRYPEIFVFKVSDGWYQLVIYNPDDQNPATKTVQFQSPDYFGAIDLDGEKNYYAYDFWDDRLAGEFKGSDSLQVNLRPGEAKMLSIRAVVDFPQLLSTDRHLMQGMIETKDLRWDPQTLQLSGKVNLVKDEPMTLVFASNGFALKRTELEGGTAEKSAITNEKADGCVFASDVPGWKGFTLTYQK
jgi:hypothetical protein